MTKLLLDTNTVNFLLKGHARALDRLTEAIGRGDTLLLSPIVHYELTRYLRLKGAARLLRLYGELTASWNSCELTAADWENAGRLWAERHRIGKAISDFDLLLATVALREQAVVVTNNRKHFLDLELEDWVGA